MQACLWSLWFRVKCPRMYRLWSTEGWRDPVVGASFSKQEFAKRGYEGLGGLGCVVDQMAGRVSSNMCMLSSNCWAVNRAFFRLSARSIRCSGKLYICHGAEPGAFQEQESSGPTTGGAVD